MTPRKPPPATAPQRVRRHLTVRGAVQGVGFRPFVYTLAEEHGLTGWVTNDADGVHTEVEGPAADVDAFTDALGTRAPPLALVESVEHRVVPVTHDDGGFTIRPSASGPGRTLIPPDTATCDACLAELADPADRRYRHPFITCTHCGPRFTVVTGLPYDRPLTTMAGFPCARTAPGSTPIRPTAASTPSRSPAPAAAPASASAGDRTTPARSATPKRSTRPAGSSRTGPSSP